MRTFSFLLAIFATTSFWFTSQSEAQDFRDELFLGEIEPLPEINARVASEARDGVWAQKKEQEIARVLAVLAEEGSEVVEPAMFCHATICMVEFTVSHQLEREQAVVAFMHHTDADGERLVRGESIVSAVQVPGPSRIYRVRLIWTKRGAKFPPQQ